MKLPLNLPYLIAHNIGTKKNNVKNCIIMQRYKRREPDRESKNNFSQCSKRRLSINEPTLYQSQKFRVSHLQKKRTQLSNVTKFFNTASVGTKSMEI
jgi:hypothetical protein